MIGPTTTLNRDDDDDGNGVDNDDGDDGVDNDIAIVMHDNMTTKNTSII